MKHIKIIRGLLASVLACIAAIAMANSEKVIQIFRNGEVVKEYKTSEIDFIEINDYVPAPTNVVAVISVNNSVTVSWNEVVGADYSIYRSADNNDFALLADGIKTNSYVDTKPIQGLNYYRVKANVGSYSSTGVTSNAIGLSGGVSQSGVYLGITAFNNTLVNCPIQRLDEGSLDSFDGFVDGLTTAHGTLLFYSVDQAINALRSSKLPDDVSTVALVTFTDGLDRGSFMKTEQYENDMDYLNALNRRIKTETAGGQNFTAYSVGFRGHDVEDNEMFSTTLSMLASSPDNATEVTSMQEVNEKFKEITNQLSQSNYVQNIDLKMTGVSNGTKVRFTFDNVRAAADSKMYIEGRFNRKDCSLQDVEYVGMTCQSGTVVKGTVDDIFVTFSFSGIQTDGNVLLKKEFTDEWTYNSSTYFWQKDSEFDKEQDAQMVTSRSSAVIMLVLDCSSSLDTMLPTLKSNAKDFVHNLFGSNGSSTDPDSPVEPEPSIYSTIPKDLSVAVWMNNKRYYLTHEQYKDANLTDANVEGLTVLSNLGNFIISPEKLADYWMPSKIAMKYYKALLPTKDFALVITSRYADINSALTNCGFYKFDTYANGESFLTSTKYDDESYYWFNCAYHGGGYIGEGTTDGCVRGVKAINNEPILWSDPHNLMVSTIQNGKRVLMEYDSNISWSNYEVEGIAVVLGNQRFVVLKNDAQSTQLEQEAALALYSDILPTREQGEVIEVLFYEINRRLEQIGGTALKNHEYDEYFTKSLDASGELYTIYLDNRFRNETGSYGYVRGVKPL